MIILIGTGFHEDSSVGSSEMHNLQMIEESLKFAAAHPHTAVWHKIHPGEDDRYYQRAFQVIGLNLMHYSRWGHIPGKNLLWDLMQKADVYVTCWSSTVLEALALRCPVIVCDMLVARKAHPECRDPLARYVYTVPDFHRALEDRYALTHGSVLEYCHAER